MSILLSQSSHPPPTPPCPHAHSLSWHLYFCLENKFNLTRHGDSSIGRNEIKLQMKKIINWSPWKIRIFAHLKTIKRVERQDIYNYNTYNPQQVHNQTIIYKCIAKISKKTKATHWKNIGRKPWTDNLQVRTLNKHVKKSLIFLGINEIQIKI